MKLVARIPVEPLDDERMTNIERRVVIGAADAAARPVRAPRRYVGFAMAAMAAVIAGVIGWQLGGGTEPAQVVGEALPIKVNTEAERATLDIGDAVIQSDRATEFVVTRPDGGVLVAMKRGKVELEVGKRGDRAALVVRAGETDVIVVGTHFTVDYGDGTGDVDVRVTEGVVKVVHHQQEVRVAAGHAWQSKRGLLALAQIGGTGTNGANGTGTGASGSGTGANSGSRAGTGSDPTGTAGDPVGDPTDTIAANNTLHGSSFDIDVGDAPDVLRNRTAQVPDARTPGEQRTGSRASSGSSGSSSGTGATSGSGGGSGSAGKRTSTIDPKDPMGNIKRFIEAQPFAPAMDVGQPTAAGAIKEYQKIILDKDGEDESLAFYSIAVVQASDRGGRTGDALRTLEGYLQRYGRGKRYAEYPAALWLKLRIVCLRSIGAECRQVAAKYMRELPGTPGAAVAERITLTE